MIDATKIVLFQIPIKPGTIELLGDYLPADQTFKVINAPTPCPIIQQGFLYTRFVLSTVLHGLTAINYD